MDNHKEELKPLGPIAGSVSNFAYQTLAIRITEVSPRGTERTLEFLTLADYAGWKELQN